MDFLAPTTLNEAVAAMSLEGAMAVGGGTSVALLVKNRLVEPDQLVYLGRIEGLDRIFIADNGDLTIGAGVTLRALESSSIVLEREPVIATTARQVGNPRVRAAATIGGALVHSDPRQDLPPVLLALDARLRVVGSRGARELALDGFFLGLMQTTLEEDELIVELTIAPDPARVIVYSRFAPGSEDDFPTVGVAAALQLEESGEVRAARIALGGVGPAAMLSEAAAAMIIGRRPSAADIEAAAQAAAEGTDPADDQRGSAAYKRAMTVVWVRRTLSACLGQRSPRP